MEQLSFDDLEIWKPVPGYEGLYEFSSLGRARSLTRTLPDGRRVRGRILKLSTDENGYLGVNLWRHNKYKRVPLHKLVALHFLGPRPPGMQVRHLDGNPANAALSNLAYGTNGENQLDSVRHGTHHMARVTECPQRHPYDEVNTYITPSGSRACRTCRAAAWRRHRNRKKEARDRAAAA